MSSTAMSVPDLTGKTYAITGATGGIGYFAAEQLAAAGAEVVLLSRSTSKLRVAQDAIRQHAGSEKTSGIPLDLTSLDAVADAVAQLQALPRLDGIFLNGGPMQFSARELTHDGLPLMVGAHTVANVALAFGVVPIMKATHSETPPRIVHASTGFVARFARDFAPVDIIPRLSIGAYVQAKALTEVFAYELHRRLDAAGMRIASLLTHPGVGVDAKTPERAGVRGKTVRYQRNPYTPWAQGKDAAAAVGVRALTDPAAASGEYYVPERGMRGAPVVTDGPAATSMIDPKVVAAIWDQLVAFARHPDTQGL